MIAARPVLKAAVYGGGAVAGAVAVGAGVVGAQAARAYREVGPRRTVPPYADGRYGGTRGVSLRLAMLGDSAAAGLGAMFAHETPGALLAERLAARAGRPVVLSTVAVVGARSDQLALQVDRALIIRPHVAVLLIGANDITHFRPLRRQVRHLSTAILRLRAAGTEVVLGTCPDLSASKLLPEPANRVAYEQSRRMAAMQSSAALQSGALTVSLADLLGAEFHARATELFAADRFHPNAAGYAALAEVLAPAVLSAAGFGLAGLPEAYLPETTQRLAAAIAQAVASPGSVLAPVVRTAPGERRALARILVRLHPAAAPPGAFPADEGPLTQAGR